MFNRNSFLSVNPHIEKMTHNDTSLFNIANVSQLQSLNVSNIQIPKLYNDNDIVFNTNDFSIQNYVNMLLAMLVYCNLEYTFKISNCNCSERDIQNLNQTVTKAFTICHSKFIEYFSGIESVEVKSNMRLLGNVVKEATITIVMTERYPGALNDTAFYLRLCEYVKYELIRNNKITNSMNQYSIAKVLFNWVVLHTTYDNNFTPQGYTGFAALYLGCAVCQGQTALYNTLCKMFGISIVGMSGKAYNKYKRQPEDHIWSFAILDNRNVYMDVTWGGPSFTNEQTLISNGINPRLLCNFEEFDIPYNILSQQRSWDKEIYG